MTSIALSIALILISGPAPDPAPSMPGMAYAPPEHPTAAGAPLISGFTSDAGFDESFLLVGEGLTSELTGWSLRAYANGGGPFQPITKFQTGGLLAATVPDNVFEGPIVVWAKNKAGYSEPVVLNAPEPWWS